jgi:hypothetical protein
MLKIKFQNNILIFTALALLISVTIACKGKKDTKSTVKSQEELIEEKKIALGGMDIVEEEFEEEIKETFLREVVVDNSYQFQEKGKLKIISALPSLKFEKEGNPYVLEIAISYGGGCKEHDFYIFTSGMYAKSIPPQINFYLVDEQTQDLCKSMIYDTLYFDYNNILKSEYKNFKIIFNDDEEKSVELNFGKQENK